jgi:hypothetical protein
MDDKQVFSLAASSFNAVVGDGVDEKNLEAVIELTEQVTVARITLVKELIEEYAEAPKETRSTSGGRRKSSGRGGGSSRRSGSSRSSKKGPSEKQIDTFESLKERLEDAGEEVEESRSDFKKLSMKDASDIIGELIDLAEELELPRN